MSEKWNPGSHVLTWGICAVGLFVIGGGLATIGRASHPALWWVAGAMLAAVVFTASVVGAYYAGKGKR